MKIEKSELKGYLNKVQMSNTQEITECILDFSDEGLKINADCPTEQSKVMGFLSPKVFKEYTSIGKIGVNDFNGFIGAIDRFEKIITMTQEGNVLIVDEGKKKVEIELINTEFINSAKEEPQLTFETTFKMPPKKMQSIFADANISKDSIIKIETVTDQIQISNTGKYKFSNIFDVVGCKAGIKTKYGKPLVDSIAKLDGELNISLGTDYPIKIEEKSENMSITIIVAPRIEEA